MRLYSRVNLRHDPEKIARKRFMMFFWSIRSGDEHTKSCIKSEHGKWSNFGGKKDGRQLDQAWDLEIILLGTNHEIIC
jgi:hypothetical protein